MLLEALALDRQVVHLQIGNTTDVGFTAYNDYMQTVYNKENMLEFITNPYKTDDKQLVEDYLHGADGKSCQRICSAIRKYIQ